MVVGALARPAAEIARRILTSEGAILGKAWWGFKDKGTIVAGIRTGLGGGAIAGGFINQDDSNPFSGPVQPGSKTPSNKFSKKYRRFGSTRGSGRNNYKRRCRCGSQRLHRRSY